MGEPALLRSRLDRMRRPPPTLLLLAFRCMVAAQDMPPPGVWYPTSGGESILSWAQLDVDGDDKGSVVRFAPFFNAGAMANYDLGYHFGLFAGISIGNIGFIYALPDTSLRFKFRTYNIGVPVGFKVGNMNEGLFFAGYEFEVPVNYKEKRFENERKEDKFNVWFSDRTEPYFHAVFAGYQFWNGICLKVKYYITNFHNEDFESSKDGITSKPYEGLKANIFSLSMGIDLFRQGPWPFDEEPEYRAQRF